MSDKSLHDLKTSSIVFHQQRLTVNFYTQIWWFLGLMTLKPAHGQEFNPVIERASWVNTGVDDQSPERLCEAVFSLRARRASRSSCWSWRLISWKSSKVQQTSGHDTAVPGTGETQSRAEEQKTGQLLTYCIINTPNNTNAVVNNRIEAVRNQT